MNNAAPAEARKSDMGTVGRQPSTKSDQHEKLGLVTRCYDFPNSGISTCLLYSLSLKRQNAAVFCKVSVFAAALPPLFTLKEAAAYGAVNDATAFTMNYACLLQSGSVVTSRRL